MSSFPFRFIRAKRYNHGLILDIIRSKSISVLNGSRRFEESFEKTDNIKKSMINANAHHSWHTKAGLVIPLLNF